MNASLLRLAVLAVMVALGVTASLYAPPVGIGVCKQKACNKLAKVADTSCPDNPMGSGLEQFCVFEFAGNNLIYCDNTTGDCPLVNPYSDNLCTGGCQANMGRACYSTSLNKCQNPVVEQ